LRQNYATLRQNYATLRQNYATSEYLLSQINEVSRRIANSKKN